MSDKQAREIFESIIEVTNLAEQENQLVNRCGNDKMLLAEVKALLKAHDSSGNLLEQTIEGIRISPQEKSVSSTQDLKSETNPDTGTMVGSYKLLQVIGEGGMGIVWMT